MNGLAALVDLLRLVYRTARPALPKGEAMSTDLISCIAELVQKNSDLINRAIELARAHSELMQPFGVCLMDEDTTDVEAKKLESDLHFGKARLGAVAQACHKMEAGPEANEHQSDQAGAKPSSDEIGDIPAGTTPLTMKHLSILFVMKSLCEDVYDVNVRLLTKDIHVNRDVMDNRRSFECHIRTTQRQLKDLHSHGLVDRKGYHWTLTNKGMGMVPKTIYGKA